MKLQIVAVGKLKERGLREVVADYERRIGRYVSFAAVELKDGDEAEVARRLRKALPPRGEVVALEVDGEAFSSHDLARLVGRCEDTAVPVVSFLIGGAYGLPREVSRQADRRVSMSRMIFPHRLARVLLTEQIYRAFTILRGEPYSH